MPYKIVQTIEKGQSVLTSIPGSWEKDGILFWPTKRPEKLKINDMNYPKDNWLKSNCIVKRTNITSYQEAEQEIERMCENSDTEQNENEEPSPPRQRKRQHKQATTFLNVDFNELAQECILDDYEQASRPYKFAKKNHEVLPAEVTVSTTESTYEVLPADVTVSTTELTHSKISNPFLITPRTPKTSTVTMSTFLPINSNAGMNSSLPTATYADKIPQVVSDEGTLYYTQEIEQTPESSEINNRIVDLTNKVDSINTIQLPNLIENQKLVLENQRLLSENQQLIILKLTEFGTQFEEMIKQYSPAKERNEIDFKVIESIGEAEILEIKLKDTVFKADLEKKFSVVCGSQRGKGLNSAYALIDLIFSRTFLKECSWAGGSRNEESKICFRAFTRIIDFFFDLVRATDKDFTKEDCKTFFKNILRNSVSRSKSKQMRASTTRNRPKSIKRNVKSAVTSDEVQNPPAVPPNVPNIEVPTAVDLTRVQISSDVTPNEAQILCAVAPEV